MRADTIWKHMGQCDTRSDNHMIITHDRNMSYDILIRSYDLRSRFGSSLCLPRCTEAQVCCPCPPLVTHWAMSIDSKPVFSERLASLGLRDLQAKFTEKGWDTYANFAFASGYVPGHSAEELYVRDILIPLLGDADHVKRSALRRFHFESYSLGASDLRRQIERGDDSAPRKIPNVEREDRKIKLEARLVGQDMEGDMEPSNSLIDFCVSMIDDNEVKYPKWEKCTRKVDELGGRSGLPEWKPDSTGHVRETRHDLRVAQ